MTIFPEFQQQLIDLARSTDSPSAPLRRRRFGSGLVVLFASAISIVIAVMAIVVLGHTRTVHRATGERPQQPAGAAGRTSTHRGGQHESSAINPAVASRFSVFRRPATRADAVPTGLGSLLLSIYGSEKPDLGDARRVIASDGQPVYLIPASDGVCVLSTNETFCSPLVSLPGVPSVDLCSPALPLGHLEMAWALPDGATRVSVAMHRGPARALAPGLNVYIVRLPLAEPLPNAIEWTDAAGQHQSVSAGIPSDAARTRCEHPSSQHSFPTNSASTTTTS